MAIIYLSGLGSLSVSISDAINCNNTTSYAMLRRLQKRTTWMITVITAIRNTTTTTMMIVVVWVVLFSQSQPPSFTFVGISVTAATRQVHSYVPSTMYSPLRNRYHIHRESKNRDVTVLSIAQKYGHL